MPLARVSSSQQNDVNEDKDNGETAEPEVLTLVLYKFVTVLLLE